MRSEHRSGTAPQRSTVALLGHTFDRETDLLAREPERLVSHLHNMLVLDHGLEGVVAPLLDRARLALDGRPWLRLTRRPPVGTGRTALVKTLRHGEPLRHVRWHPGGQAIVAGSADGALHVWEARTGVTIALLEACTDRLTGLDWSTSGDLLATASSNGSVVIWDTDTWQRRSSIVCGRQVDSLAWSPDGTSLACGIGDLTVEIRAVDGGGLLGILGSRTPDETTGGSHGQPATNDLDWSAEGDLLAVAGADRTMNVWNVREGRLLRSMENNAPVLAVSWSPAARAVAWSGLDIVLHTCDLQSSDARELTTLGGAGYCVAWSPDGTLIAVGSSDNLVRLVDVNDNATTLTAHTREVTGLSWSPDGTMLASASADGTVCLWDTTADALSTRAAPDDEGHVIVVNDVALSPDGDTLVSVGMDSTVRFWDATSGAARNGVRRDEPVSSVVWEEGAWGLATLEHVTNFVDFRDEKTGISGQRTEPGARAHVWNPVSSRERLLEPALEGLSKAIAVSPGSDRVAAGGDGGTVLVWHGPSGQLLNRISTGGPVLTLAWRRDGQHLASGGPDGVRIWDLDRDGSLVTELHPGVGAVTALAWSSTGATLAVGGEGDVALVDLAGVAPPVRCRGHRGPIRTMVWGPDGFTLLSGSDDCTLRAWDASSGARLAAALCVATVRALRLGEGGRQLNAADDGSSTLNRPVPYLFEVANLSEAAAH